MVDDHDERGSNTNPMTQNSIPALLAEEWTINPFTALPSFLEVMMMEDVDKAATKVTKAALEMFREHLRSFVRRHQQLTNDRVDRNGVTSHTSDRHGNGFSTAQASAVIPNIQRIALQWAVRFASGLGRLLDNYGAEMRCLFRYALERRFLKSLQCSTMAESVYGTIRVKAMLQPDGQQKLVPLETTDQTRLALLIALGPYCQERFQQVCTRWNAHQQYLQHLPDRSQRLQRYFLRVYPIVLAALQGANLFYQWRYLLGESHWTNLRNMMLRQVVRRVTQQDVSAASATEHDITMKSQSSSDAAGGPVLSSLALARLQSSMLYLVQATIAVSWLTQLRTWYQQRYRQQQQQQLWQSQQQRGTSSQCRATLDTIIPPPRLPESVNLQLLKGCPLCGRLVRIHPTACAGYVFCLSCILPFVREHGRCPVTGSVVTESQLVRLYEPSDIL